MPDEGISEEEVRLAICKSHRTVRINDEKYKFRYRHIEVVALKCELYWLVITCYRLTEI